MADKIYTRTGDKGQTSLFGGKRVLKNLHRVETYGTVDELNSTLGVAIAFLDTKDDLLKKDMEKIQKDLLLIGATLANPANPSVSKLAKRVDEFEKMIDILTEQLPELRNFILPGGCITGAYFHLCRTTCRQAERQVVALSQEENIDDNIRMYLNRLSDLFFTIARFINHKEKYPETIWQK